MTPLSVYLPFNRDCLRGEFTPAKHRGATPAPRGHWLIVPEQKPVVELDGTPTEPRRDHTMPRVSRGLLVAAVALAVLVAPAHVASAADLAEFIGRSDQNGTTITHYGYVTHVNGVPDADLFFDPTSPTAATARLTYFATTTLDSRHVLDNIITTATAPGTLTFYVRASGGATFSDPSSFAAGSPIVALALRYFNVLNVQGTNAQGQQVGIASATARAEGSGVRLRFTATGQGTLLTNDPASFVSVFRIGGTIVTEP